MSSSLVYIYIKQTLRCTLCSTKYVMQQPKWLLKYQQKHMKHVGLMPPRPSLSMFA